MDAIWRRKPKLDLPSFSDTWSVFLRQACTVLVAPLGVGYFRSHSCPLMDVEWCQFAAMASLVLQGILLLYLLTFGHCQRVRSNGKAADFLKAMLFDYDDKVPPMFEKDEPCEVWIRLFISSFNSIKETDMEFSTDLVIEQRWMDKRLQFHGLVDADYLELDTRLMTSVWVPDLYISNEKHAVFHDVTVPNRLLHLYHNGSIIYKARISVTATCYMDLQNYPLDRQTCSLFIKSFAFTTKSVVFRWAPNNAVSTNPLTLLPNFNMVRSEVAGCDGHTEEGNFTCLKADFHLERQLGFFLLHLYMPTSLVVTVSWLSFWLHPTCAAARTSLGILTVLTVTSQATSAASSLPKVSYIKAIDIWMAACLFFVFTAFIQYAVVSVTAKAEARRQVRRLASSCLKSSMFDPERFSLNNLLQEKRIYFKDPEDNNAMRRPYSEVTGTDAACCKAEMIDRACRVVFPVAFLIFGVIYWLYFAM